MDEPAAQTFEVTLDHYEQAIARMVGVWRWTASRAAGLEHTPPIQPGSAAAQKMALQDQDSAGSEYAVAKFWHRHFRAGVNVFHKVPDILPNIEVRLTNKPEGKLLVRPNDVLERRYVLVRGTMPTYTLVGWMYGYEAAQDCWLDDPNKQGPCWLVPGDLLHRMDERPGPKLVVRPKQMKLGGW